MALQAPMHRRACQVRESWRQRMKAVIQWQERVVPERDNHCLLFRGQNRRLRRLRIDTMTPGKNLQAFLTILYCSTDRHDHARCPSSNTAIASFDRSAGQGVGHQPEDSRQMAQARDGRGSEDRTEGATFNRPDRGRGGHDRRISAPHTVAAGRRTIASTPCSRPCLT